MNEGKEHKLAAARLKLKQYRSKRVKTGDPSAPLSNPSSHVSPALSSRASSCEPLTEIEKLEQNEVIHQSNFTTINSGIESNVPQQSLCTTQTNTTETTYESPQYGTASSLFTSNNAISRDVDDFFDNSVKYALGGTISITEPSLESVRNKVEPNLSNLNINNTNSFNNQSQMVSNLNENHELSLLDHSPYHHSSHERDSSVESGKTEIAVPVINGEVDINVNSQQQSTVENLKQISMQLEGLVNEADIVNSNSGANIDNSQQHAIVRSLEERNSTLAQQLQEQQLHGAQLNQQVQQLSLMIQEAHKDSTKQPPGVGETPASEELNHVRQQLHVHVQTVGILVAEKTQLESTIMDMTHTSNISSSKITELEGRLSASRHRVEELESTVKSKENEITSLALDRDRLQYQVTLAVEEKERFKLRYTDNELRVAELGERVRTSGKDQQTLHEELADTKTQLHMAKIRIEQLRNSSGDSANILDELNTEKKTHQTTQEELCQANQLLAQFEATKTKELGEYQLYTQQINAHVDQLKNELIESEANKQQQKQSLIKSEQEIGQYKVHINQLQQSASSVVNTNTEISQLKTSTDELNQELEQAKASKKELEQDNLSLSRFSEEMRAKIESLELSLDRQQTGSVDNNGLLARIQSDKVATSRALAQNKILKDQLAELQDGFVMMSNKKLELTEKLERELHVKKGLHKQLGELTDKETKLRDDELVREKEVEQLRESCSFLASQVSAIKQKQKENPSDNRIDSSNSSVPETVPQNVMDVAVELQKETDVEETIIQIKDSDNVEYATNTDSSISDTNTSSISSSTTSSDSTRNDLQNSEIPANRSALLEFRLAQLSSTHSALVNRFNKAMSQVAELNEDKQILEVTVEQLQLENDTIGDYITIYQFKRGVLSQQMREKDLELDRLRGDKQSLVEKLSQLQELAMSLCDESSRSHHSQNLLSGVNRLITDVSQSHTDGNTPLLSNGVDGEAECREINKDSSVKHLHIKESEVKKSSEGESKTVTRILDLIKEMEKQPSLDSRPIQPCGLCSGSLITV